MNGPRDDILIVNRKRDELACELCGWTWLVPLGAGVYEVYGTAVIHWNQEHDNDRQS